MIIRGQLQILPVVDQQASGAPRRVRLEHTARAHHVAVAGQHPERLRLVGLGPRVEVDRRVVAQTGEEVVGDPLDVDVVAVDVDVARPNGGGALDVGSGRAHEI